MQRLARLVLVLIFASLVWDLTRPVKVPLPSGGELSVTVDPEWNGGRIFPNLGPGGEASWQAHRAPYNIEVGFVPDGDTKELPSAEEVKSGLIRWFWANLNHLLLAGIILVVWVFSESIPPTTIFDPSKKRPPLFRMASLGAAPVILAVVLGLVSAGTFKPGLNDSRYTGPLFKNPEEALASFLKFARAWENGEINLNLASRLRHFEGPLSTTVRPTIPEETIDFLIVSDLHDNPTGVAMTRDFARDLEVDAILDLGDFTSWGTPFEANELRERLADLSQPHLIVAGNHESTKAIEVMEGDPNVTFLDNETIEITGVSILGASDPAAMTSANSADPEAYVTACQTIKEQVATDQPDILMVHNPEIGKCAAEYAEENGLPLIFLWGHTNEPVVEERGSVLALSPGTSGTGGFEERKLPYGFGILKLNPATNALVMACYYLYEGVNDERPTFACD
ncbi:MAG: metallophosphoesterase family protein [Candidatus Colwellbacteria bacterium]|nr:metallophosphoesterase family protein [Candidatus Colwellbacteria bacterium]